MTGLYNMVFGVSPIAAPALRALDLTAADFGRFRDVWLQDDEAGGGLRIVVHTRCGGGNREAYEAVFERMRAHPHFIREADCDFDSTYANIEFRVPEQWWRDELEEALNILEAAGRRSAVVDNRSQHERWQAATEALKRS
jgi:hypothetical protein